MDSRPHGVSDRRDEGEAQIATRVPNSTTRLAGMLKKSVTLPAFRAITAKSL
jgi:hypothetical protein